MLFLSGDLSAILMNNEGRTMKQVVLVIILVSFASILCAGDLPLPETAFKKGSALYHEDGMLKRCKLKTELSVQGYPCQRWVWFYADGGIKQFELSEPKTIQDIVVPSKSTVFLRADRSLEKCWFSKDMMIQGIPCNGGSGKVTTEFHKNGKISCCFLSESTEIQGVPCKDSIFKPVYFHPSGKLKTCTLSRRHTIEEKEYRKGTTLHFDKTGRVEIKAGLEE